MDMKSYDVKNGQMKRLIDIFPGVVSEGKIDINRLKRELGLEEVSPTERYGLTWAGKANCFKIIQDRSTGTLKPGRNDSIAFDATQNVFIEGENLEVLKLLQKAYYGRIHFIYIDPPYNTGSDFVYSDTFGQQLDEYLKLTGQTDESGRRLNSNTESDGRYHSNWLNMMYPRLYLARNLLSEDGIIFISVGEDEYANLKILCDEVFGGENYLINFIWEKTQHFGRQKINCYSNADYILCYTKEKTNDGIKELLVEKIKTELEDAPLYNASNPENTLRFTQGTVTFNIPDGTYDSSADEKYVLLEPVTVRNGTNVNDLILRFRSRWSQPTIDSEVVKGGKYWVKTESFAIRVIYGEGKTSNESPKQILFTNKNNTLCTYDRFNSKVGVSEKGTSELAELLDSNGIFDYPKPVSLIRYLLSLYYNCKKEEYYTKFTVLDFFAGSGTTAHAVMDLNREDGGNRKFICVQLPEPTPADSEARKAGYETIADIAKERIRRAAQKIKEENPDTSIDLGFKVFRLDRSNFKVWDSKTTDVQTALDEYENKVKEEANPEDVLYELLLKAGFELTTRIEKKSVAGKDVYSVEGDLLIICLENGLTLDLFRELRTFNPERVIVLDSGFAGNDQLKTNAVQILGKNGEEEYVLRSI